MQKKKKSAKLKQIRKVTLRFIYIFIFFFLDKKNMLKIARLYKKKCNDAMKREFFK